jgi:sec-independent protein translocase protein TatA|tara:strand:+ start:320 stop:502 length:183 start_codon:yes stop_codon:yes gene_type:complete
MFGLGHWEIILILVIILILFGAGKLPKVASDIAKGIKSFKEGMKEEDSQEKKISEKKDKK